MVLSTRACVLLAQLSRTEPHHHLTLVVFFFTAVLNLLLNCLCFYMWEMLLLFNWWQHTHTHNCYCYVPLPTHSTLTVMYLYMHAQSILTVSRRSSTLMLVVGGISFTSTTSLIPVCYILYSSFSLSKNLIPPFFFFSFSSFLFVYQLSKCYKIINILFVYDTLSIIFNFYCSTQSILTIFWKKLPCYNK